MGTNTPPGSHLGCSILADLKHVHTSFNGTFPPRGAGRVGAGSEGAVLLRWVTCRVSTTDSTLMVGGV